MKTDLRGRDLISDLDFTKEEVETVLDVAFDLKMKRALGQPHAYLDDKTFIADQIRFVVYIRNHLTMNGIMEENLPYEPPFTDLH